MASVQEHKPNNNSTSHEDTCSSTPRKSQTSSSSSLSSQTHITLEANETRKSIESTNRDSNSDSNNVSAKQSPPTQVMERSANSTNPNSPSYRIPSYVFSRTNTTAPIELWSSASNESLFSIHMGNMSFTRDYMKSGELGIPRDSTFSGHFIDFSNDTPPSDQTNNCNNNNNNIEKDKNSMDIISPKSPDVDMILGVTEAKAVETLKETIRENEEDCKCGKLPAIGEMHHSTSRRSDESSVKSFAFPILGDADKSGSLSVRPAKQRKPSQQPPSQPESPKAEALSKDSNLNPEEVPKPKTPQANSTNSANNNTKWLSCFPCCGTFCT